MARHDDIDPIVARRQERQRQGKLRLLLVLAGLAVGGLMATAVVVGFVLSRNGATVPVKIPGVIGVTEGREGETWTHTELEKYLEGKGMKLKRSKAYDNAYGKAVAYSDGPVFVTIAIVATPREAKVSAGVHEGWSWGNFVFTGNTKDVERIKQILQ